ncbi:MAG: hypothetical protein ACOYM9_09425 [Bradymonadia bacterium]
MKMRAFSLSLILGASAMTSGCALTAQEALDLLCQLSGNAFSWCDNGGGGGIGGGGGGGGGQPPAPPTTPDGRPR